MREVFARIGFGHWRIQRTFASWPTPGPSVGGLTGGPGELFVVEAKVSGGTHLLRCALSGLPSLGPLVGVQTARGCAEQPSLNGNRRQYACGAFWSFSPPALRECRHRGLDARGLAQMMRVGLYRPVHVKTLRSQKLRVLLTHRKLLQSKAIDSGVPERK